MALKVEEPWPVSEASAASAAALPNRAASTSLRLGWKSLLLERHACEHESGPFEVTPTPDQTFVMALVGDHELAVARGARWRSTLQQQGGFGANAPGESPRLRWRSLGRSGAFQTAHLYIPQGAIHSAIEELTRAGRRPKAASFSMLSSRDDVLHGIMHALLQAMEAGAGELYAQSARAWLIMHLLHREGAFDLDELEKGGAGPNPDRRLARAIEALGEHLDRTPSLDALAAHAGLSKFHFLRLFRRRTGATPHRYLTRLRMEAARALLTTTSLPITEIARRCGYNHAANFATAFARAYAQTPSELRRRASSGAWSWDQAM